LKRYAQIAGEEVAGAQVSSALRRQETQDDEKSALLICASCDPVTALQKVDRIGEGGTYPVVHARRI
jgi:hypothetical protein